MTSKTFFLVCIISLLSFSTLGQTNPPAVAMPTDSSVILVNKIIEVTKHEKYFTDYCTEKVKNHAIENNWTPARTTQTIESIKFKYYRETIYNSYAFYSFHQLKTLLDALTLLNSSSNSNLPMILTNSMMQSNLDLFLESVIKGKYLTK